MRALSILLFVLPLGCAAAHKPAALALPALGSMEAPSQAPVARDHFHRDTAGGGLSEEALRELITTPVRVTPGARLGVIHVSTSYEPEASLPTASVPLELAHALEDAGLFQVATEMSTDWPADRGLGGLRELAARYRAEYILLYRHRFRGTERTNGWGWLYPLVVTAPFLPSQTLEAEGVLEATLFDVRTGSLLFTAFERARGESDETPWGRDRKRRALEESLLDKARKHLADQVVEKARRLVKKSDVAKSEDPATARVAKGV